MSSIRNDSLLCITVTFYKHPSFNKYYVASELNVYMWISMLNFKFLPSGKTHDLFIFLSPETSGTETNIE